MYVTPARLQSVLLWHPPVFCIFIDGAIIWKKRNCRCEIFDLFQDFNLRITMRLLNTALILLPVGATALKARDADRECLVLVRIILQLTASNSCTICV
jgi:hypothetical protein